MKFLVKKRTYTLVLLTLLLSANLVGYAGAYLLTNYRPSEQKGIGFARPKNYKLPSDRGLEYTTQRIDISNSEWLETWSIEPVVEAKGTVILFHGKDGIKSNLIEPAKTFYDLGYRALLVDFRGSGKSSGNVTTIGAKESKDVVLAVNYIKQNYGGPIVLYGFSMGSAAILKAISEDKIEPDAIVLEHPFARLTSAVKYRLKKSKVPTSPIGELLVFWGGIQHGFNGFAHNPVNYAARVKCPTLIVYGEQDVTVDKADVEELYAQIPTHKKLVAFSQAQHELLVKAQPQLWRSSISSFLKEL